jgi:DNA-binding NtrC family response regulator
MAIEAMRAGAFDYITKPFDLSQVKSTVARAAERRAA